MKRSKNKKGSHVGVVLSFTLFIIFLVFIYAIIAPNFTINEQKRSSINDLKTNLLNEISEEIILLRAYDSSSSCIEISDPSFDFSNPKIVAVDSNSAPIALSHSSGEIQLEGSQGNYKIYYSDGFFEESSYSGTDCIQVEPKSIVKEERILEEKLISIISQINTNYSVIRQTLKVPGTEEFNVQFEYANTTLIGTESRDVNEDIYAETFKVDYLDSYGAEKTGGLIIRVW